MSYEEYLNLFNELKLSKTNYAVLKKLQETPVNTNILELLGPKYVDVIIEIFERSIKTIINELSNIFNDVNYLDLALVTFKKEILFIKDLINIDILDSESKEKISKKIKEETENTFQILIRKADELDPTGVYGLTIKNNKIKWSDTNEL